MSKSREQILGLFEFILDNTKPKHKEIQKSNDKLKKEIKKYKGSTITKNGSYYASYK